MAAMPSYGAQPLEITFGIEAEYIFKYSDYSKDGYRAIATAIEKAGFRVDSTNFNTPRAFNRWTIEDDSSCLPPGCIDHSLELRSRILKFDNKADLDEVRAVIDTVKGRFQIANVDRTGLHVHVGNGIHGLPLKTLQNLALMNVGFEHLLATFHPEERILGNKRAAHFARRPSVFMPWLSPGFERLLYVLESITFAELESKHQPLDGGGRDAAINFWPMRATKLGNLHYRTVEFRQHRGTKDPDEIVNWVQVVCSLVKYCHDSSDAAMAATLSKCADDLFDTLALLREIGCGHLAEYYEHRLFMYSAEQVPRPAPNPSLMAKFQKEMAARDSKMKVLEDAWSEKGKPTMLGVDYYNFEKFEIDMKDPWILWNRMPFDRPWDEEMEESLSSVLVLKTDAGL